MGKRRHDDHEAAPPQPDAQPVEGDAALPSDADDPLTSPVAEGDLEAGMIDAGQEAEGGTHETIAALQEELASLNDRYLRLAAEFDNFRKRTVRERADWRERAQADFARQLLETLDDLGRVVALETAKATVHDVIEGIHMVERKLMQELERTGFERVGVSGEPFDPNHHEAVATQPAVGDAPAGTVSTVLQPGYRLGNVLLRPARVIVTVEADDGVGGGEADTE